MKTLSQLLNFIDQYDVGGKDANHLRTAILKRFSDDGDETDLLIKALTTQNIHALRELYGSFEKIRDRLDEFIAFMRAYDLPFADPVALFFMRVDWTRVKEFFNSCEPIEAKFEQSVLTDKEIDSNDLENPRE